MSKFTAVIKRYPTTSIVFVIILILLTWWTWANFSPKPLGDKLEYLGKKDYGNIFGFDSKPYSVYYYGTDMDEVELKSYFSATYSPLKNIATKQARFTSNDGNFTFTYEKQTTFDTAKEYTISITDGQYSIASKYLANKK